MFTKKQVDQIIEKGLDVDQVNKQIDNFIKGFPFLKIKKPAVAGDGITILDEKKIKSYISRYDKETKNYHIIKFIPASGAATRMFKALYEFLEKLDKGNIEINVEIDAIKIFFDNLKKFAFYNDLKALLKKEEEKDIEQLLANKQYISILKTLLTVDGLNYGNLPKGLLKFHSYDGFNRTSVEEHFVEAAKYCVYAGKKANIHFTVSPEHIELFEKHFKEIKPGIEEDFKINIIVSHSVQKPSTDMVSVDNENKPVINENGELFFRPGGHGSLVENLNDLDADIVFIKNIDNVVPDNLKPDTIKYKKAIAGVLIETKERIFSYLHKLNEQDNKITDKIIKEIQEFINKELSYSLPGSFNKLNNQQKVELFKKILNRPIRVCGMVKNAGEPGGGPFWTENDDGAVTLQIVESSQVDMNNPEQKKLFEASTHFNPVDIVCYKKNYKGGAFNLPDFRDPDTGFISKKSKDGKTLKAQELPGLWNGGMAHWNTIFVEVPLLTFNPVKTVNDLLRPEHQRNTEER